MLLYADSKLAEIKTLVETLNQNAQEAKSLLSPANIKASMSQNFAQLENTTNQKFSNLSQAIQSKIDSMFATTAKQLASQNTQNLTTTIQETLTDEKIKSIVGVSELKDKVSSDFLAQNTQNIANSLKTTLQESLKEQVAQDLQESLAPEIKEILQTQIGDILEHIEFDTITFSSEQMEYIATSLLAKEELHNILRVSFSAALNEKLHHNPDFLRAITQSVEKGVDTFVQSQFLDFKHFLLKSSSTLANQITTLQYANTILTTKALEDLELKFDQELAKKRQEYQESLKNPNAIKHNVYQTI